MDCEHVFMNRSPGYWECELCLTGFYEAPQSTPDPDTEYYHYQQVMFEVMADLRQVAEALLTLDPVWDVQRQGRAVMTILQMLSEKFEERDRARRLVLSKGKRRSVSRPVRAEKREKYGPNQP